jgi:hypothetical protein
LFLLATIRFQIFRQGIELQFPEHTVLLDPCSRISHGLGRKPASMYAAIDLAFEQPCGLQHAQVFRNGGQRNGERLRQLRNHGLTLCEAGQDGAAGGIGERAKRGVQRRGQIVNHMV